MDPHRRRGGIGIGEAVMNAFAPVEALTVRVAGPADRAAIRAFVEADPDATPFHLPEWSEAIERGCGQHSLTLVAERGGRIAGLLPLTQVRSPLFGSALVSTGFGVEGGVLGEGADALAEAAWVLAQSRGCGSVELRGGPVPTGWAHNEGVYFGFSRDLPQDDE